MLFYTQAPASAVLSSRRHALREHVRLPGLVLRGLVSRGGLWPGHALVPALHPLLVRLLVQTAVRGFQVSCGRHLRNYFLSCVRSGLTASPVAVTGATALSASSSSSLFTSVSLAFTSCRPSASAAGERGDCF